MLDAFASLKCSKKCWHNVQKPSCAAIAWEYLDNFHRYVLLFYSVLLQMQLSVLIVSYCSNNVSSRIRYFIYYLLLIVILTPHPHPPLTTPQPPPSPLTPEIDLPLR